MAVLTAVVIALSIAVGANFVLLLAVVRRLRLQRPTLPPFPLPPVGMQAPSFVAQDADGNPVDDGFYFEDGEVIVAFFSDDCQPCERVKAELARDPIASPFLAFLHTADGGSDQAEFAAGLAHAGARIVLLEPESDIPKRFSVSAFPTLLRLRDGIVVTSTIKLAEIRRSIGSPQAASRRPARVDRLIAR
jgi:thiol-disulfide isomerase/thioredoxin